MSKRIQRVNSLIKQEISQLLLKDVDFSDGALVTVTRVETSVDLNESKVFISVLPSKDSDNILKILNKIIYGLQKKIDRRLRMRPIPRIKFVKDEKPKEAARIEEILGKIKIERP